MLPLNRASAAAPPAMGPVAHLIVGAASGILAVVGLQYLLVRRMEQDVSRAVRTISE